MKKTVKAVAILALLNTCAYAQVKDSTRVNPLDELVISDTKFAQSKEKSGKVIEVITSVDLAKKSGQSLATVLSQVAGVEINGNQSANGKNLGYYIRGGRNRQVLIVIDGIPVTDASGISMEYDLRLLPVDQVESIEIMKGASSTLYGTGAATGVITITLKKASNKVLRGNAYVNIGSNNTADNHKYNGQDFNQGLSFNGKYLKVDYLTSLNSTETNGMSEAKGENYENDRFSRIAVNQKIGVALTSKLRVDFFGNYDRLKNAFDDSYNGVSSSDNLFNQGKTEQFRAGFSSKYKYSKGEFVINSGASSSKRNLFVFNSEFEYKSKNINVDAFNKFNFSKQFFALLGTQYQFSEMNFDSEFSTIDHKNAKFAIVDPYTTVVYNSAFGFNLNVGVRINNHSVYNSHAVYNFNPSYTFGKKNPIRLLASYSTAYITPSLYQLYDAYSGNIHLEPEENSTVEAGFEIQLWSKKVTLNTVAFLRNEKNAIDVDANFVYFNIEGKNKAKGIETSILLAVTSRLSMNANYTFNELDEPLQRLNPKHKVNAAMNYQFTNRFFAGINYQYLSSRIDAFGYPAQFVKLDAYRLFNATLKYELIKNRLTVFGAATNIFNEEFVENIGYSTRGRNFKVGLNIVL
ncbi:TonB-dependent receptor plug domain-containing protein [Flavobacterium sp.]|uniref:TonB-dependent receptor plug domain-containing protein n=1 Tax=Flavobacterium sp. TaxID=239 RepID=UPI0025EE9A57|nr:TonB-dependent receptor plug domain-containing protein [Flavobacterium sp.]